MYNSAFGHVSVVTTFHRETALSRVPDSRNRVMIPDDILDRNAALPSSSETLSFATVAVEQPRVRPSFRADVNIV